MRFRTGGFEIESLPLLILWENGEQVPHPLSGSSFCSRHNNVVMWPKNNHPAAEQNPHTIIINYIIIQ